MKSLMNLIISHNKKISVALIFTMMLIILINSVNPTMADLGSDIDADTKAGVGADTKVGADTDTKAGVGVNAKAFVGMENGASEDRSTGVSNGGDINDGERRDNSSYAVNGKEASNDADKEKANYKDKDKDVLNNGNVVNGADISNGKDANDGKDKSNVVNTGANNMAINEGNKVIGGGEAVGVGASEGVYSGGAEVSGSDVKGAGGVGGAVVADISGVGGGVSGGVSGAGGTDISGVGGAGGTDIDGVSGATGEDSGASVGRGEAVGAGEGVVEGAVAAGGEDNVLGTNVTNDSNVSEDDFVDTDDGVDAAKDKEKDADVANAKEEDVDVANAKEEDVDAANAIEEDADVTNEKEKDADAAKDKEEDADVTNGKEEDADVAKDKEKDADAANDKDEDADVANAKEEDVDAANAIEEDADKANVIEEDAEAADDTGEGADEAAADDLDEENEEVLEADGTGSIAGFLWIDGNGDLDTDWDGLYNGYETPLEGVTITLYPADNLSAALAQTRTDSKGNYVFERLKPGNYVLGLKGESIDGVHYLAPIFITSENMFAIDWSIPGLPAYTEIIALADDQAVENVNAGMRLQMAISPRAKMPRLNSLKTAKMSDSIQINNKNWVVVRTKDIQGESGPIRAVYLIMRGSSSANKPFGTTRDYATSALRSRLQQYYAETNSSVAIPIIKAIALKPDKTSLGAYSKTEPTGVMAGNETEDILFAPSYVDMTEWTAGGYMIDATQISNTARHPLSKNHIDGLYFPTYFYFRTPAPKDTSHMAGYNGAGPIAQFDEGIAINSTQVSDTPGVWINANATERFITFHYIDTNGKKIHEPITDPYVHSLDTDYPDSTWNLKPVDYLIDIDGYEYIEWRKGIDGAAQSKSINPNLAAADVLAGKDIYLVYMKLGPTFVDVTVSKEVTGEHAQLNKRFTFTVYFAEDDEEPLEEDTEFDYIGGVITGYPIGNAPSDDKLTLDADGKATFSLRHGQTITILDVPSDIMIKVIEEKDKRYRTFYTDSKDGIIQFYNSDAIEFDLVGDDSRKYEFLNEYIAGPPVPPTGIDDGGGWKMAALPLIVMTFILLYKAANKVVKRRIANLGER